MNVERTNVLLVAIAALALMFGGGGCATPGTYPTLRQTQINVSWPMTRYRNLVTFGKLTQGQRERVDAAYAEYDAAFKEALKAAGGNYDATTPENVKELANRVIQTISTLSWVPGAQFNNWCEGLSGTSHSP
jgi:hypothetical protein